MAFIVFFHFSEYLTFGTFICSIAECLQAAHPLHAWGWCKWPHFKTVQYSLYLMVFHKLSNIAFSEGNIDYIVQSRGVNPIMWLADCYILDDICKYIYMHSCLWNYINVCVCNHVCTHKWWVHTIEYTDKIILSLHLNHIDIALFCLLCHEISVFLSAVTLLLFLSVICGYWWSNIIVSLHGLILLFN